MIVINRKIFTGGIVLGAVGVLILLGLVLTNVGYPNPFFRILMPIGVVLVCLSLIVVAINWIITIKNAVVKRRYGEAILILLAGLIFIAIPFIKDMFR